ncbi:MAG TPA: hypothetical protein PKW21_04935 [Rhabdaerophilum sp.]|nr:hypothetical protein [Rhabdaerophilum sp.]
MTPPLRSYWLLASEEDETLLMAEVAHLAACHGTPVFRPHLTLLGDIARESMPDRAITEVISSSVAAFSLPVADIVTGESYFRSFYAAFALSPELLRLRTTTSRLCEADGSGFMPHVSLLYGPVERAAKAESAAEVRTRLKGRMIRFDRVALTNSANDVPIADWRCLEIIPLGWAGA